ncbi:antibiotic biosynthesis monooxygenase family protein [Rothia sp. P6271]|uniref:antibiotic biosynthesis monooxygenase family protein n=1 Tax=unclassified Rothia (in: high G+C Gram-positive bacteria) TaxID=2689056 RepID=UPI003AC3D69A
MTILKINKLAVKDGNFAELEKRFAQRKHSVDQEPGFEGFELLRPTGEGQEHYFVITRWADEESFQAWAAKRSPRDPNTTVSRAEGTLSFEVVDLPELEESGY